jgi:hypothetical protein
VFVLDAQWNVNCDALGRIDNVVPSNMPLQHVVINLNKGNDDVVLFHRPALNLKSWVQQK